MSEGLGLQNEGSSLAQLSPFSSKEILDAHALLSKKLFKNEEKCLVSTILASAKSGVQEYMAASPSLQKPLMDNMHRSAILAISAMHHKTMSEGAHILYNLEITAALLSYLVEKV